jgi:Mrp family chromosome partitioning ATPase
MIVAAPLTKFEQWVKKFTALKLAIQLANRGPETKASLGVIYAWIRGEHEPRSAKRRAIIQISAGELTLEDIDAHFAAKNRK